MFGDSISFGLIRVSLENIRDDPANVNARDKRNLVQWIVNIKISKYPLIKKITGSDRKVIGLIDYIALESIAQAHWDTLTATLPVYL